LVAHFRSGWKVGVYDSPPYRDSIPFVVVYLV
jgi:hypothetical protein